MNMDGIRRIQKTNTEVFQSNIITPESIVSKRRSFLKYVFLGSGILMMGKLFGPSLSLFAGAEEKNPLAFKNFNIREKGKDLHFFDKSGDVIFTLDKTA